MSQLAAGYRLALDVAAGGATPADIPAKAPRPTQTLSRVA